MLRNRIIFSLIFSDGNFMQSRNFKLQKVGDINWLKDFYKFQDISFSLDELIVLDATKGLKDLQLFADHIKELSKNVFLPITAGGGISSLDNAKLLFNNGADKIVINSLIFENNEVVKEIIKSYGSQSVVASIDYKYVNGNAKVFINNGSRELDINTHEMIKIISSTGVGEIIVNSIDRDGTGFGYDVDFLSHLNELDIPIIISGGAGNSKHFMDALDKDNTSAVATANLLNFVGDGLPLARRDLINEGYNLANHNINEYE